MIRMVFRLALPFLMLFAMARCAGQVSQVGRGDGPVDFRTILSGTSSAADTAAVYLIENSDQWRKTWRLATGKIEPAPALPEIDFKSTVVVAAFMGEKTSSGHRIEIARIIKSGQSLKVFVIHRSSSQGMLLPVLTSPFHLVSIPKGKYKLEVKIEKVED